MEEDRFNTATLQVTGLRSSEWLTSSGYFCTERCSAGSRRLGSAVLENVLTCPVVDGVELEHRPGYTTGQEYGEDRELSEDDKYKWDYCSPAEIEAVVREEVAEVLTISIFSIAPSDNLVQRGVLGLT